MSKLKEEISRVTRSKTDAGTSYDRMSRWYDFLASPWEKKIQKKGLEKLGAAEREIVLEIGFGTGQSLLALGQSIGESGRIYGFDISEGMCNRALKRIQKAGLSERIRLTRGDAVRLPFKNHSFDAMFISFTLELFDTPEIPDVLSECTRVLRSGKRLVVVAMSKMGRSGLIMRLYEWAHRRFPRYLDCRPIFVQNAVQQACFQVLDVAITRMFGLPVEIVLAKKNDFQNKYN